MLLGKLEALKIGSVSTESPLTIETRGATLVEFALAALIIMGMVGFFFEGGTAYFRYSVLVNSLTHNARRLSLDMRGESCLDPTALDTRATNEVRSYMSNSLGLGMDVSDLTVDASVVHTPSTGTQPSRCTLSLRGRWPAYCFFCIFFQDDVVLGAEGESFIEDECFACSGSC